MLQDRPASRLSNLGDGTDAGQKDGATGGAQALSDSKRRGSGGKGLASMPVPLGSQGRWGMAVMHKSYRLLMLGHAANLFARQPAHRMATKLPALASQTLDKRPWSCGACPCGSLPSLMQCAGCL